MLAAASTAAIAIVLLGLAWREKTRRAWALFLLAGVALFFALRAVPLALTDLRLGQHWNWTGHLLALAGMIVLALVLHRRLGVTWRELGFVAPRAVVVSAFVVAVALALNYVLNPVAAGETGKAAAETWLFVALMPGLAEEIAFRSVLLAAATRAAPARFVLAGAPISVGALLLTLAFVSMHGANIGTLTSVLPAALLYLWLRAKSGSVLVPIVAHNLWNLTVLASHL